jgi:hypothetical protein
MIYYPKHIEVEWLTGKTFQSVVQEDRRIIFNDIDGVVYIMAHDKDCCEEVWIDDVCGDLQDLVDNPILLAEEVSNHEPPDGWSCGKDMFRDTSETWTFFKFSTIKGHVTIRWYGTSNGYYSESADIYMMPNDQGETNAYAKK